jgi:tetratricopeptide (TPR) repeat protein
MSLARTYRSLVDGGRALPHALRAAEIRARYFGPDHPETLEALAEQACAYHPVLPPESKRDEYLANVRRVFEAHRRVLGPEHRETLGLQVLLASFLDRMERFAEARVEAVEAQALAARALGPDDPVTQFASTMLGWTEFHRGDGEAAEALMHRSFEALERILGPLHPDTILTLDCLTILAENRGRWDEALPLSLETFRRKKEVYGPCHVLTDGAFGGVVGRLSRQRDFPAIRDLCEGLIREVLAMPPEVDAYERSRRSIRVGDLVSTLATLPKDISFDAELAIRAAEEAGAYDAVVSAYARLGRFDTARKRLAEGARRSAGDPQVLNRLSWILATAREKELQDPAQAVALARKAVELNPRSSSYQNTLGVAYYRSGDWNAAIAALEKAETLVPDKNLALSGFFLAMAHWQLGDKQKARIGYGQAVQWMDKNQPENAELRRFRAEAAELLNVRVESKSEKQPP